MDVRQVVTMAMATDRGPVLGVVAGPRCSGNTAALVREVLRGAGDAGSATELVCMGELSIGPLIEGSDEDPFGVRGPEDDMLNIYLSLEGMGAFVFGTPVYYDHVSARAKTFIDRLIYYFDKKDRFPKGVPAVLAITYEWNKATAYDDVMEWMVERFEHYFKMKVVGKLVGEGTTRTHVRDRPDLMKKAYEMGESL
jgi:multimeric flavodoxin WrbA